MKRVVTTLGISWLLAAGWVQAQPSPSNDIRESTDPSRATQVEQKARSLGDTGMPADQAGAGMSSSGTSTGGISATEPSSSGASTRVNATGTGADTGSSVSPTGTMTSPTGTEDMSGVQKSSGSSSDSATSGSSGTSGTTSGAGGTSVEEN